MNERFVADDWEEYCNAVMAELAKQGGNPADLEYDEIDRLYSRGMSPSRAAEELRRNASESEDEEEGWGDEEDA